MADLEENEVESSHSQVELESYSVITEPFSCSDEVGAYVIENIESLSGAGIAEAELLDSHHLIVDSVLNQNGHMMTSDGHLVTTDGQLFRLYKDSNDLGAVTASDNIAGHQTIILRGLSYSQELLQAVKTEEDDDGLVPTPSKKFCLESEREKGYDIILSVSAPSTSEKLMTDINADAIDASGHLLDEDSNQSGASKAEDGLNSSSEVSQSWFTTKGDKLALQSKGHQWKQGQWTKQEIDTLQRNIAQYCEERSIENASEVIFDMTKDERKNFYRTIARGLQRPLFSVYRRVIRMYDRKNYIGKYTPEELTKLKELRKKHGSDWATIGSVLGRSASSVKDRCRLMKDTCNTGKWYPEEEKRLAEVVYRLSGASPGESVTSGLSWAQVAEHVNSRSEKQCRTKWLNYLNWKEKGGAEWTRDDDLLLLERLSEVNAKEEGDINWISIAADWPSARSPQWLHGKWWSMKRHINNYSQIPFPLLLKTVKSMHAQSKSRSPPISSSFSPSLPSVFQSSDGIKVEHFDFQNIQMMPGMTLTIPVTMSIDGSLSTEVGDDEESHTGSSVRSYQLLEDVCDQPPDHSDEAYVIADSDTMNSSAVFTTNGIIPDNFVVHTLQSIGRQANTCKNVLVQMNPAIQEIIVTRDLHQVSDDSPLILSNHEAFHQLDDVDHDTAKTSGHRILSAEELEQEEEINPMAIVTVHDDLDVRSYDSANDGCDHMVAEIMTTRDFPEVIIESEIHEAIDSSHSLAVDLVSLTGSHFAHLEASDNGHSMSSFSDSMLITDSADLLSSISDGGKSQEAIDNIDQSSN